MKNYETAELKRLMHYSRKRRLSDKERRRVVVLRYQLEQEEKQGRKILY